MVIRPTFKGGSPTAHCWPATAATDIPAQACSTQGNSDRATTTLSPGRQSIPEAETNRPSDAVARNATSAASPGAGGREPRPRVPPCVHALPPWHPGPLVAEELGGGRHVLAQRQHLAPGRQVRDVLDADESVLRDQGGHGAVITGWSAGTAGCGGSSGWRASRAAAPPRRSCLHP